jgi:hypothetical protein
MPQYTPEEIKEIKRCFNLYVKFPKNRWKEIARAEKDDTEGNKILNFLREEYLEKYMPAPNDDPHDIIENPQYVSNNGISKSSHQDEII